MYKKEIKQAGIEVSLSNLNGKYTFPNDNFLNGKTVVAMWIPDNADDNGYAPSGANLVPNECIRASQLTIRKDSDAKALNVQLKYFLESDGDRSVRPLYIEGFNPGTTFIEIQDTGTFDLDESIVFMVEYMEPDDPTVRPTQAERVGNAIRTLISSVYPGLK